MIILGAVQRALQEVPHGAREGGAQGDRQPHLLQVHQLGHRRPRYVISLRTGCRTGMEVNQSC